MPRILVGIVDFNPGVKDYAFGALFNNLHHCVSGSADILFVASRPQETYDGFTTIYVGDTGSTYSEDHCYAGRNIIQRIANAESYDAFIWQGSDCYYPDADSFRRFISRGLSSSYKAVGALTPARTDETYAVARRFISYTTTFGRKIITAGQTDIPEWELETGDIIPAGFPGADALLVKKELFDEDWTKWDDFEPWYRREGENRLCTEEFWCRKVIKKYGDVIGLDTSIRCWHVHEDGTARRWPGETRRIEELKW